MQYHHHYTDKERQWLKEQSVDITYQELTEMFNNRFGTNVSESSIKDLMSKRLKIKRTPKGQFEKGARPKLSVGDEVIKQGYIWVKVNDVYHEGHYDSAAYRENWRRKADVVWESVNGKLPKDLFLVFLDKNPLNCDIDNLYPVNRKIHAVMSKNGWYTENRDITLAGIKWCELYYLIQDKRSGKR